MRRHWPPVADLSEARQANKDRTIVRRRDKQLAALSQAPEYRALRNKIDGIH
jgi:hypothetical protein